jgi:hypothetical protein
MRQKIIKSQVNKLAFFSCCPLPHLSNNQPFRLGRGDAHGRGGGCTGGGGGMHVHPVHPPWVRHWNQDCCDFGIGSQTL